MSKTKIPNHPLNQKRLLLLSFIEGACVMVAELAGGKMLAPFFGSSLYVWASTLAITLGALTLGYYIGGEWSKQELTKRKKTLFTVITIASALVIIMPAWANQIMSKTIEMNFLTGMLLSQILFLLPPILGMGIVSPMLISLIAENNSSGKAAGMVYAISTLGGVIATLLTGFYLVPVVGIAIPCVVIGTTLFLLNVFILRPQKKTAIVGVIAIMLPSTFYIYNTRQDSSDKYDILYHSEGMLGQIKVMDFPYTLKGETFNTRCMLVNHNWQTWTKKDDNNFSLLFYTRFSNSVIKTLPTGSKALLIGLGGGTLAKQLEQNGLSYDAVEIDGRLPVLAEKFFGLQHAINNTIIDDGRHYINVCKRKYDLIIIDALLGDSVPSHLLSIECFQKLKNLLEVNGKIFIEFDGFDDGAKGMAQQLLLNTIKKAGFSCKVYTSLPEHTKADIMYLATLGDINIDNTAVVTGDFFYPPSGALSDFEIKFPLTTTDIITDDYPVVDFYLKERVASFRREYSLEYYEDFLYDDVPFFK